MYIDFVFPFNEIARGSRVLIYGAGKMGKAFVSQCIMARYCEIAMVVDKNYQSCADLGMAVNMPEKLLDVEFDKLLIAINERFVCMEICNSLRDWGIQKEKIWTPFDVVDYVYDKFANLVMKSVEINVSKGLDIAFFVPAPIIGGGGCRNIYRAIYHLQESGHNLTVYYTQTKARPEIIQRVVTDNFYDMSNVKFVQYEGDIIRHDVAVATWWETAYIINEHRELFKKIFYFVQDYEPYFSPISSEYILASNTYKLGFHHICSGKWIYNKLIRECEAVADYFQFPLDSGIYNLNRDRVDKRKSIVFFAKPEMSRRCFKLGIEILRRFNSLCPEVVIKMYGSNIVNAEEVPFQTELYGVMPTLEDLATLYTNSDLGIVFSTTNPSLVPYEMMSCGLPVADIDFDYAIDKYGNNEDNVFLLDTYPEKAAHQLASIISDKNMLKRHSESGRSWALSEFPDEICMGKTVESIILSEFQ